MTWHLLAAEPVTASPGVSATVSDMSWQPSEDASSQVHCKIALHIAQHVMEVQAPAAQGNVVKSIALHTLAINLDCAVMP